MEKKGIIVILLISMLISVTILAGCVGPWSVKTLGWDHLNDTGTAVRLWGQLTITESPDNWNEGFVWDTESHQNWNDYLNRNWADDHYGLGLFSIDVQNLSRTTVYHYRAFAENTKAENLIKVGPDETFVPGGPRVFTDNTSGIGLTQVTFNGNLWQTGGASSCEVFFVYGTDQDLLNKETPHQNLTETGLFNATLTGLITNTTYFYKAVAINDADTWVGIVLTATPGQPVVFTRQPGEIGKDYAVLKGDLRYMGGPAACTVWFVYSDKSPNDLNLSTTPQLMNTTGEFEARIENLRSVTTYWYRTVADNGVAQGKGDIYQFTTTPTDQPLTSGVLGTLYTPPASDGIHASYSAHVKSFIDHHRELLQKYPMLLNVLQDH